MEDLSDAAVSPVVAVLLMAAITVILAATVFVLASRLNQDPQEPPVLASHPDEQADAVTFVRTDGPVLRSEVDLVLSVPGHFAYNGPASTASAAAPANVAVPLSSSLTDLVVGGDALSVCADGGAANVRLLLVHPETNTVLLRQVFTQVASCA